MLPWCGGRCQPGRRKKAKHVIAQINPLMPRTIGQTFLRIDKQ
jgi:hypothetical protein